MRYVSPNTDICTGGKMVVGSQEGSKAGIKSNPRSRQPSQSDAPCSQCRIQTANTTPAVTESEEEKRPSFRGVPRFSRPRSVHHRHALSLLFACVIDRTAYGFTSVGKRDKET
jgi:hypothetical protein